MLDINRLSSDEVAESTHQVAQGKSLPAEVIAEMVSKTDGVPLFVEELTKMLLESGLLEEREDRYELTGPLPPLAIPNTLHDSLMARLDRLAPVEGSGTTGATWARVQLPTADRPFRRGTTAVLRGPGAARGSGVLVPGGHPPQASYRFKHALIQDAAYQSLLKSTRQQHHQRIAARLGSPVPGDRRTRTRTARPPLHRGRLTEQAIPYWQAAGQRALSASPTGRRPTTRRVAWNYSRCPRLHQRAEQELALQTLLGPALSFVAGPQSLEHVYARARELARASR